MLTVTNPVVAAITPHKAGGTDDLLSGIAISLMDSGWRVRGLAQERYRKNGRCQYALVDLESSHSYPISQNLGGHSKSCSLDPLSMAEAAGVLRRIADEGADLAFVNRFGKQEAQGDGFSAEMLDIISRGIPLLTIVQDEYLSAWRAFTGGMAIELPSNREQIERWLLTSVRCPSKGAAHYPRGLVEEEAPQISLGAAYAHGCCSVPRNMPLKPIAMVVPMLRNENLGAEINDPVEVSNQKLTVRNGALANVRHAQGILQQELAGRMDVSQAHIANLEQKTDMLLSTLRRYVNGLGGELDLVARFPGVSYHLGRKNG